MWGGLITRHRPGAPQARSVYANSRLLGSTGFFWWGLGGKKKPGKVATLMCLLPEGNVGAIGFNFYSKVHMRSVIVCVIRHYVAPMETKEFITDLGYKAGFARCHTNASAVGVIQSNV